MISIRTADLYLSLIKNIERIDDIKYLVDGITKGWAIGWRKNGWKKADKKPVKNVDLWERLLELMEKHSVTFNKVKGHADDEYNNRCDRIAVREREKFA